MEFKDNGYRYKGKFWFRQEQGEKEGYWWLQGQVLGPGKMALVTVAWDNEKLEEWAIETFKSVQGPRIDKELQ